MLSGISLTCFAMSYALVLVLEVSRLFFRVPVRVLVMIGFMLVGLFTHTIFLWNLAQRELAGTGAPFSNWFDWCLVAAWVLAASYLGLVARRPQNSVGLFLLPLVLGLIGTAFLLEDAAPFRRTEALNVWRMVHAVALLLGTVAVMLGFAAGIMYLVQSYRLKHKLLPRQGFKLPSLEWLLRFNKESLFISTGLLGIGLLSGILLNLIHTRTVAWNDPVVFSSGILFLWLMAASLFESFYKPAREGHKVAYLTLVSMVFLGLALALVLLGGHGGKAEMDNAPQRAIAMDGRWEGAGRT